MLKKFILTWVIDTLAVLVAVYILGGRIYYERPMDLAVASLLLGVLNAVLRPVLTLLSLPLLLFTLGLFRLVINALLLYLVGYLLQPHFRVASFKDAFWGALIISIISTVLHVLTGTNNTRSRSPGRHRSRDSRNDGGGPVIDI